jgi:2-haloacid dehalogenase
MVARALVFDAYGTLFDVQSVCDLATRLCGEKGDLITQIWRLKQLEYTWLRSLMLSYQDFWPLTRAALEFALESAGVVPTQEICGPLMEKYLALDLYAEAYEALRSLQDYKLAILSNGSPTMLDAVVLASGIAPFLADVISVERAKTFKPDPRCYELVAPALGVAEHEVLFVSSNGFDVAGAKHYGFKVVWIGRAGRRPAPNSSEVGPSEFYRLLRGQEEKLDRFADFKIAALTDLAPLLAGQGK